MSGFLAGKAGSGLCRSAVVIAASLAVFRGADAQTGPTSCWTKPAAVSATDTARKNAALGLRKFPAVRTHSPPKIDGAIADAAWCDAEPVGDFIQSRPNPGAIASLATVARVLYDDEALYVAVRAYDAHHDSISAPYPRRDNEVSADWIFVELDTRFDHRSGFSFGVNARGVQVDGTWWNDVNYDPAWNGIWQTAARIDSLGWTAEFRIPFSQLALSKATPGAPMTFGVNVYRTSPHAGETSNFAPRLPTVVGVISHFNELRDLVVPPRNNRFDIDPYVATTQSDTRTNAHAASAGGDLRFRPTSSTALALTVHPDFGQVEADPSQINLTTFETFLPEQRPLFIEGAEVFQFNAALAFASRGTSFGDENPFYSRRIGRRPHGACPALAVDCDVAGSSTVLGALRASGRNANGWAGGLFHAWTNSASASYLDTSGALRRSPVEPLTNFTVARASREFNSGAAAIGGMTTVVDRVNMNDGIGAILPSHAVTTGVDGRTRFGNSGYELTGFALATNVSGSVASIDALKRLPQHRYANKNESNSLGGVSAQTRVARIDGDLQWSIASRVATPGFEMNDVGFQRNANWLLVSGDWRYQKYHPGKLIRRWSIGSSQAGIGWTTRGERRAANADITLSADFRNYWGGSLSVDREFSAFDPEVLRGGPSLLLPAHNSWEGSLYTDSRKRWQTLFSAGAMRESASGSNEAHASITYSAFLNDRLQVGLTPNISVGTNGWQYVGGPVDSMRQSHYVLGALHQNTTSVSARATYAFSSTLTIQTYAQLFLSGGRYDAFREVANGAAESVESRVPLIDQSRLQFDALNGRYLAPAVTGDPFAFGNPDYSDRETHVNFLLRWEFHPGSTMFVAFTHQQSDDDVSRFQLNRDLRRLFDASGTNALSVKLSYLFFR